MDIKDKLLKFYKELYFFELDRKDKLTSALHLPLAILTLISGALGYYFNNIPVSYYKNWLSIVLFILLLFSLIAFGYTLYYFFKSLHNYEYGYVSRAEEIDKYTKDLEASYKGKSFVEINDTIDKKYENFIFNQFCKYSTVNSINNDLKSGYLYKTTRCMIFALVLTILCAIPFFVLKYRLDNSFYNVKVVNLPKKEDSICCLKMMKKDQNNLKKVLNQNNQHPSPIHRRED